MRRPDSSGSDSTRTVERFTFLICAVILTYLLVLGYALLGWTHWWEWAIFIGLHIVAGQIIFERIRTSRGR
jgi:hypothetical protein